MTADLGPDDVPVLLVPSDAEDWLEVRGIKDDDLTFLPVSGPLADAARVALSLGQDQKVGVRTFVCHPDDLPLLDGAARRFIDEHGFARAFAHDADGHFVVNARYKEVLPTSAAFDPVSVALLAAQMETQAMLEQMQIQLKDIQDALDYLKEVDGVDLEADILGHARLVDDLWRALQMNESVPDTDWDEVQHLGTTLATLHSKVLGRLASLRRRLAFTTLDGAQKARNVNVRDVKNLFQLERYVYRALCQHFDLSMAVRKQRDEDLSIPLERAARTKADHLNAGENERIEFAAISPSAKIELDGSVFRRGVFAIMEQRKTIRDGMDHVARVGGAVPATLSAARPVMRLTEAERPQLGLPTATERIEDSDSDL